MQTGDIVDIPGDVYFERNFGMTVCLHHTVELWIYRCEFSADRLLFDIIIYNMEILNRLLTMKSSHNVTVASHIFNGYENVISKHSEFWNVFIINTNQFELDNSSTTHRILEH